MAAVRHKAHTTAKQPLPVLYSIGHSTRSMDEFIDLLRTFAIQQIIDARTVPKSRRMPWFSKQQLAPLLRNRRIAYRHIKKLGGLRHSRRDSVNAGWRNASFRGYADYMATAEFEQGLQQLIKLAGKKRIAVMCAEAVPWRCHRSLIADALLARDIEVRHITSRTQAKPHRATPFAVVDKRADPPRVTYPPAETRATDGCPESAPATPQISGPRRPA